MADHRWTDPAEQEGDPVLDLSLRPRRLEDFIGQEEIKANLRVFIDAARQRGEVLDHVLLHGPPGLGKTTLSQILAAEMDLEIRLTSGPAFTNSAELIALLSEQTDRRAIFIDEIHRLGRVIEEHLYPAMEDWRVELIIDKGPNARHFNLQLEPFTLIGATTRAGLITPAMRSRFGIVCHLDFYPPEDLATIVARSAGILGIAIEPAGALEIARRSRGTPRAANRLLRRVRDFAQVGGHAVIDRATADDGLTRLGVDAAGLEPLDRRYLQVLIEHFAGGPVGVQNMSVSLGEETDTLEDVVEPFLIQTGLLKRTPRGREATAGAWRHLGLEPPLAGEEGQATLLNAARDDAFQFDLPGRLIAQTPPARRGDSRCLLVAPGRGVVGERVFRDLAGVLRAGDRLVLNDSRVLPARLWTRRADTGGRVEILLLRPHGAPTTWTALARPARRLRADTRLVVTGPAGDGPELTVTGRLDTGEVVVSAAADLVDVAEGWGVMPLPPYIRREPAAGADTHEGDDRERYQTVYARPDASGAGSVAAPTAGLHFSPATLADLADAGVAVSRVSLHVGPGTFQPPTPAQIAARRLHGEHFRLAAPVAAEIAATRAAGGRVIAVGTTSLRVLETVARLELPPGAAEGTERVFAAEGGGGAPGFTGTARRQDGHWEVSGETRLFIAPPDRVTAADGLLTNFHLPGSSLLMLVAALLGGETWRAVYDHAVAHDLRFYSYGDCMLALPESAGAAGETM